MTAGTKTRQQTLPVGCVHVVPRVKDRMVAVPCCCLPSSEPETTQNNDRQGSKILGESLCHAAPLLCCAGAQVPIGFDSMPSFWMLDPIPRGCYHHHCFDWSALLHPAPPSFLRLSRTGALPCLSAPCGILSHQHRPSALHQFSVSLLFSTISWSHSSDEWVRGG